MSTAHFSLLAGTPLPLGTYIRPQGINFSVFSRHAKAVWLVLDIADGQAVKRYEIPLDPSANRSGDIWHILVVGVETEGMSYGYRMDSNSDWTRGAAYNPETILLDPYCQKLLPRRWGEKAAYGATCCCRIAKHNFDWQGDRPLRLAGEKRVIYELHPRGFTASATSGVSAPGTYRGIIEKIPYLKDLGITTVELMPVTEFDENDCPFRHPETGAALKNFWGYNPLSFFALKSGYAADPDNHLNEFKEMVRQLHLAGIEVFLDMVFNHSGEGGYDGTTSSFRGLDNQVYYLLNQETGDYLNYSGCGNTLNCNHVVMRDLVREALRYWVVMMHVDGFRFDLASIFGRDAQGRVVPNPPLVERIAEDPVIRGSTLIAEAWDASGLYQVGNFSSNRRWAEWNGHYRDDVRRFFMGEGSAASLATRLAGSSDLYQSSQRGPLNSINFLTSHDGFTLYDLVSYNQKDNSENGEDNRDGDNNNLSWNSGLEGDPCPAAVLVLRLRRMKSMICLLLLSQGVPMLTAGDEFARSQRGNNNAWCQDNFTGWVDWSLLARHGDLRRFFKLCLALRRKWAIFSRSDFFPAEGKTAEIEWQSLRPGETNWIEDCHVLGLTLRGETASGLLTGQANEGSFFLAINGDRENYSVFAVPEPPKQGVWHLLIDAAATAPNDFRETPPPLISPETISVAPLSVVVLYAGIYAGTATPTGGIGKKETSMAAQDNGGKEKNGGSKQYGQPVGATTEPQGGNP
ncbi:MAG: isoamylase [Desulfobulbaceae bacterium]|jgi:glycogen operon protein|nr:isoamylase [Desulfobulbaceae bacterium]